MKWVLKKEKQRGVERYIIRCWENGKPKRLPTEQYRRIRDDYEKLVEFVKRLNAPYELKMKVDYKHAFINDALIEDYREYLETKITGDGLVGTEIHYLKAYFLHYFLTLKGIIDPSKWIDLETKWITYLLKNPEGPEKFEGRLKGIKAETTKRKVIAAANRFMHWLHKRRPEEIPLVKFETIGKAKFNAIKDQRRLDEETKEHVYIPKKDLDLILNKMPANLAPFVMMMLRYGLRLSEALGVQNGDVKKDHFFLQRQLKKVGKLQDDGTRLGQKFGPPKGRKTRRIPHWFSTNAEAYKWVQEAQKYITDSRGLWERWRLHTEPRNLHHYTFHDLRHTWTTDAVRIEKVEKDGNKTTVTSINPREVQLAAGHKNLSTTMGYLHDDRSLDDDAFIPDEVA
jgi:integrase